MNGIARLLRSNDLVARVVRGAGWTASGFAVAQVLRLASNLVLTRLLFPEAFGLMALVSVFIAGLTMFSDVGLGPSILQNKRGDDEDFLNTAWTIQVVRGVCMWLGTCILALPLARFYGEPALAQLLPVAGLALVISGFNPTRLITANRHLLLGRITAIELLNQVIALVIMVALTWYMRSVWALVIGGVIAAGTFLIFAYLLLPGKANRLRWERESVHELVHFGKWIFFSTALGFLVLQGDKLILGKYLSIERLGIYNIGYFLASFPLLLGGAVIARILIPLYRERPPQASPENFIRLRWMRFALSAGVLAMLAVMAFSGAVLVDLLYDPRYAAAGGIVVIIACIQIVQLVGLTYDQSALAAGDSRSYFAVFVVRAALQIGGLVIGFEQAGLIGALAGQAFAAFSTHFAIVWLARRHGAWDPLHDAVFAGIGLAFAASALWVNQDAITTLLAWRGS